MRVWGLIVAVAVVAMIAFSAVLFAAGEWPLGVLVALAAVCAVVIYVVAMEYVRANTAPPHAGYVERETVGW